MRSKLTINIILTFTVVSIASQQATLRAQQRPSLTKGQLTDTTSQRDPHHRDEIVQLGYSTQLRGDVTGAVATVSGETLERSPVANLTQTLPGRLAGLTTL